VDETRISPVTLADGLSDRRGRLDSCTSVSTDFFGSEEALVVLEDLDAFTIGFIAFMPAASLLPLPLSPLPSTFDTFEGLLTPLDLVLEDSIEDLMPALPSTLFNFSSVTSRNGTFIPLSPLPSTFDTFEGLLTPLELVLVEDEEAKEEVDSRMLKLGVLLRFLSCGRSCSCLL